MTTLADVLKAIADDKSLVIFNTIALSNIGSEILISRLQLTRKQYYSRMSTFLKQQRLRYYVLRPICLVCEA